MVIEGKPSKNSAPSNPQVHENKQPALIVLWVIAIAAGIIILILLFIWGAYTVYNPQDGTITGTPYCSNLTSGLPDISDQQCCLNTNVKYNDDLFVDMSPAVIGYQYVCKQFCSGTFDPDNDSCSSTSQKFTNCISAMKPVNCIGQAMPLGISSGTLYYGNSANLYGCQTEPCQVPN